MTTIRPATREDVAAMHGFIVELAEYEHEPDAVHATAADLERALFAEHPAVCAHVAEVDGQVSAMAIWYLTYSTWEGTHGIHLEDLYVSPTVRGGGLGRALLAELARIAVDRGYKRVEWSVLRWNAPAIGLYDSIGAAPLDEWLGYRLEGEALAGLAGS